MRGWRRGLLEHSNEVCFGGGKRSDGVLVLTLGYVS